MRKVIRKLRISKYKRFLEGLLFAIISLFAILLCIADIVHYFVLPVSIMMPFTVAIISLFLGFLTMFHGRNIAEGEHASL